MQNPSTLQCWRRRTFTRTTALRNRARLNLRRCRLRQREERLCVSSRRRQSPGFRSLWSDACLRIFAPCCQRIPVSKVMGDLRKDAMDRKERKRFKVGVGSVLATRGPRHTHWARDIQGLDITLGPRHYDHWLAESNLVDFWRLEQPACSLAEPGRQAGSVPFGSKLTRRCEKAGIVGYLPPVGMQHRLSHIPKEPRLTLNRSFSNRRLK